jgi:hypothetical protein
VNLTTVKENNMAANIQTLETSELVTAASTIRAFSEVRTAVEVKLENAKKALINSLLPLWEESLGGEDALVTNFKIPSGEVVEMAGEDGEVTTEINTDGNVVQVVMKVPTSELKGADILSAQQALGGHYNKLFEEGLVIDSVSNPAAFLLRASEHPKAEKLFKLGATGVSFKVPDAEFFKGTDGVELRTAVVNKTSFISKVNDLPVSMRAGAREFLSSFLNEHLSPTVQVGNRTEAATEG